jgi:iron complex transport system ATP-binding protein
MSDAPTLVLDQLSIMRGDYCTADRLSLQFEPGKLHAVLGPNGAGKSSLIRAIFGELPLCSGSIAFGEQILDAHHLHAWRQRIGYMPQDDHLDAALTTLEVVLLGNMQQLGMRVSDEQLQQALTVMQRLEIAQLAHRPVATLSGGQRQLALFAQALLGDPQLLMLDEPVSALDLYHTQNLLQQVREETHRRNLVTIIVLHDLSIAAQFADRLVLLGDARVQADGTAEDVLQPELIAQLYHVHVERLYGEDGRPVIRPVAKVNKA